MPSDDINFFVIEFPNDVFYPGSSHADTSANRINLLIGTVHRHLGPEARLSSNGTKLDSAIRNFTYFDLEETTNEIRMAS